MEYKASSAEEQKIIDYFLESYNETNFIAKFLYKNFFNEIENMLVSCRGIETMLEVGCGLGESSLEIQKMLPGVKFEVSEYDENYVKILRNSNFPLNVTHETVYNLQHSDSSFDCVILLEVLEHLDDYEKALEELFRVSNKYVLISVPNEPLWKILNFMRGKYMKDFGNTPGHINHFNLKELSNILSKYGKITYMATPIPWVMICVEK